MIRRVLAWAVFGLVTVSAAVARDLEPAPVAGRLLGIETWVVMLGDDGAEYSPRADGAEVTCDGKPCKLEDLKPSMKIRITTKSDDKEVATRIEALDKNVDFDTVYDGKLVRIDGDQLVMTRDDGKDYPLVLASDPKVTCDGKSCTTENLKQGMTIRVIRRNDDKPSVVRIEAVDKRADFRDRD